MGNNGGLLLCIIITHYYIRIMSCVHVIMCSFWHIITYYYMLLHIAAFLLLAPCVMSWQVPGPAHHIYWIPQMMMFWSPTRLSPKPCGAVDLRCSSATMDGSTRRDCAQGPAGCDSWWTRAQALRASPFLHSAFSDAHAWFITPDRLWSYHSHPASNIASVLR